MGWILIGKIQTIFLVKNLDLYMNCTFSRISRRGLSRELMEAGIKELKEKYLEIRLNVFAGNFAKEMYEEFGFVERQVIMTLK